MAAINAYLPFLFLFFAFLYDNVNAIRFKKKKTLLARKRLVLMVNALLLLIASLAPNFQCCGFPFSLLMMPYSCGSNMVRVSCNTNPTPISRAGLLHPKSFKWQNVSWLRGLSSLTDRNLI